MEIQQAEREDSTFSHRCLFCRDVFTGNRALLFQHMLEDHSFNVGQPDNLGMNFNETTQLMMIILLLFSVRHGIFGHATEQVRQVCTIFEYHCYISDSVSMLVHTCSLMIACTCVYSRPNY